jgi:hypothetical protein
MNKIFANGGSISSGGGGGDSGCIIHLEWAHGHGIICFEMKDSPESRNVTLKTERHAEQVTSK